jgi:two-component system phosphate regulon sensor histidine kinase PhoR
MVDSLITASGLLNTNPDILKKLNTSLESAFPGLKHHISAVIKGTNVYYPDASQLADNNDKAITIRSQLNPADLYTISFINLGQFILYKLTISIMLSLIYIGVCISSLLLLINNIKKNKKLMVQKDNFTNNMAHELKTPIATLHAAAEALSTYNFIDDKVLAREYIEIMKGDLKRLENMAESILLNSKVNNGKIKLLPEPIEVRKIIDTIITSFVPRMVSENAIVEVNGGNNIYINGDTEHLKNVFINLLDNSLKYAADNVKVVFKIEKTDNVVSILISDNGIGIAAEHQLDIFIPYYRVSEGDRHSVKGFGLGLSYAKEIIRLHNGSIKLVASTPHSGSEFEIILPAL